MPSLAGVLCAGNEGAKVEMLNGYAWATADCEVAGELADVALYLIQLASVTGVDLEEAIAAKLNVNYGRTW